MGRNFAFLSYSESADPVLSRCLELGLCGAISPQHNADVNAETGELKKPHFHVLLSFCGNKSENSIRSLASEFGPLWANGAFLSVSDKHAYYRYLYHGDNKDKTSYNPDDIICFGGFNPPTDVQDGFLLSSILQLIKSERIFYVSDLVSSLVQKSETEMLLEVRSHPYFYAAYLRDLCDHYHRNDSS